MKPDVHSLQEVFYSPVRFLVPAYQRPYVWERDEQWSRCGMTLS